MMKFLLISILAFFFLLPDISAEEKFIQTHFQNDTCLMTVSTKALERDILVSTTILKGSARKNRSQEMRFGYGGDAIHSDMIRFVKEGNKLLLVRPVTLSSYSEKSIFANYSQSAVASVIASFTIKSETKEDYTIDVSSFVQQDNSLVSLSPMKEELKLGAYDDSKSYVSSISSYPENINFKSVRSYMPVNPAEDPSPTTWEIGTSWFILPEKPMQARIVDERIGYFATNIQGTLQRGDLYENTSIANRWRLEPRKEDIEKYKRGELVEPQKPIMYYIDRATPEYLVPYFIKAVEAWNTAFEKAGFKHAITARLAPTQEEDSTYSEEDIRYSLISYKASPIPNAYGPMLTDPRSGEILNSHVAIYHSVLELLQRWYFVMCSAVEPNAREYPLSKDIMGQLASTVVTHEVGHTLGLLHNFAGSIIYSADSLRNVDFVRKNGIGASVMDYQRFDYLAQPGDGFTTKDFLPKIGKYDDFAIEWGYRHFPDAATSTQEAAILKDWVDHKRIKDSNLFFLRETDFSDPRIQSEDSGSDQIIANSLCINNLKIVMDNLLTWNPKNDNNYYVLRKRYLSILSHYETSMDHVLKIIGGRYTDNPSRSEGEAIVYLPVPAKDQRRAIDFLCQYILNEPTWLFNKNIMDMTKIDFDNYVARPYNLFLTKLMLKYTELDKNILLDKEGYTSEELYNKLLQVIFTSKDSTKGLSPYERTLQSSFLSQLSIGSENLSNFMSGNAALTQRIMMSVKEYVHNAQQNKLNFIDMAHYKSLENFITIWETGKQKTLLSNDEK